MSHFNLLQVKVLEYLASDDRTNPKGAFNALTAAGFFGTEDVQIAENILRTYLVNVCEPGRKSAMKALGLKEKTYKKGMAVGVADWQYLPIGTHLQGENLIVLTGKFGTTVPTHWAHISTGRSSGPTHGTIATNTGEINPRTITYLPKKEK